MFIKVLVTVRYNNILAVVKSNLEQLNIDISITYIFPRGHKYEIVTESNNTNYIIDGIRLPKKYL